MPVTQILTTVGRGANVPAPVAYATYGASPTEGYTTDITVFVENWTGDRIYWTVVGKGSPAADPNTDMTGTLSGYWDPGVGNQSSVVTNIGFVADATTEGIEYWGVDLGAAPSANNYWSASYWPITDLSTAPPPQPPFSLEFVENEGDYLEAAGSSDWNLGDTWTIEFWLKTNAASATANGGIWGLLNQVGWSTTNAIVVALSDNKLVYLSRAWNANDDVRYTEPTPGQWTHVAIANDAGTQKVFYNGAEQTRVSGNVGSASYTNGSSPLRIGRLGPANGGTLNGKMALVRISNTAKYSTTFTPTTTYGVEADTKLFLSLTTPLVDSMSHTITNNGVTLSNDVPVPLSLQFVQSQTDYLDVAASTDWALSRTWTIEFWSKASKVSTEGDLLTVMCQDYTDGNSIQIIYQAGTFEIQGTNRIAAEPTPGVWTHVALVNTVADGMTLYYNGVSQYAGGYWSLANNTAPIRIGARGTADFQRFDGLLALIRISNTAKYTGTFTPSNNYGVEADTKLFLGGAVPLIDAKGHITTNNGVSVSTDFPT